jgi:hypothetical protein
MAFDGVPDSTGRGTAESRFVAQMGACLARGLSVQVVADPASFSYLYVIAPLQHAEFGDTVAQTLARRMRDGVKNAAPVVLNITPSRASAPGARRQLADVRYARLDLSATSEGMDADSFGESDRARGVVATLNLFEWLRQPSANRAAWRISWNRDPQAWTMLSSAGTRLAPPEIHSNQPLEHADRTQRAMAYADAFTTQPLNACPMLSPADFHHLKVRGDLQQAKFESKATLYQSIAVTGAGSLATLELELLRGTAANLEWLRAKDERQDVQAGDRFILGKRSSGWLSSVRQTRSSSLSAVAVVSPALQIDDCAVALAGSLLNTHQWGTKETRAAMMDAEPALERRCGGSPLEPLMESFFKAKFEAFPKTGREQPGATDMRVGMETLASIILAAGRAATDQTHDTWRRAAAGCLLQAIKVVVEPEPPAR